MADPLMSSPAVPETVLQDAMRRSTALNKVVAKARKRRPVKRANLGSMLQNAGRFSNGLFGSLAGGVGTMGAGATSAGGRAWNAVAPQAAKIGPETLGISDQVLQDSAGLARAGVRDMGKSLNPVNLMREAQGQPTTSAVHQHLQDVRARPGVTPGIGAMSGGAEAIGNMAGQAALTGGAAGQAAKLPVLGSVPGVQYGANLAKTPIARPTLAGVGRTAATTAAGTATATGTGLAADSTLNAADAGAADAVLGLPPDPTAAGEANPSGMPQPPATQQPVSPNPVPQQPASNPPAASQPAPGQPTPTPGQPAPTPQPMTMGEEQFRQMQPAELEQYVQQLPETQQAQAIGQIAEVKIKDHIAKQFSQLPPDQQAAKLGEMMGKLQEGGLTMEDLQQGLPQLLQDVDPTGQLRQEPGFMEQVWGAMQQMEPWQVFGLSAGLSLGLLGLMSTFGGGDMLSGILMSVLGLGGAAWSSGAFDQQLQGLGVPTLAGLLGGGQQTTPVATTAAGSPAPASSAYAGAPQNDAAFFEQQGELPQPGDPLPGEPADIPKPGDPLPGAQPGPAAALPAWAAPYVQGGQGPGMDSGDAQTVMQAWAGGKLQDQQVQELLGHLSPQQMQQLRDKLRWAPGVRFFNDDVQKYWPQIQKLQRMLPAA